MKHLHQSYHNRHAPELYGDFWFNTEPISLHALQNQTAVLFFWDYSLPQSQNLIPLINRLYSEYNEYGVVIIGVHSPEFFFGKNPQHLEQAIKQHQIIFPVLADNDRLITTAYAITSIPSICLIDHHLDVYDIFAEKFSPERIERSLQYLLRQSGFRGELSMLAYSSEKEYGLLEQPIHEIFTGYSHGALGNPEGYSPELPAEYADPKIYFRNKFYAHGIWCASKSSFEYIGEPDAGYIIFSSDSEQVDILIGSSEQCAVTVLRNDVPIDKRYRGDNITYDQNGNSLLHVKEPHLFSVMKQNDEFCTIKCIPSSAGIAWYMFACRTLRIHLQ